MSDEEKTPQAPGIAAAWAQPDEAEGAPRRRRGVGPDPMEMLRNWTPKTRLGHMVQSGQILTIDDAFASGFPIREVEIVDALLPGLEDDIINVNMIQRMTDSGRRVRFNVMACVGNKDGYVGLSICKGKEVASTIRKAIQIKPDFFDAVNSLGIILTQQGKLQEGIWLKKLNSYKVKFPKKYNELQRRLKNRLPATVDQKFSLATRQDTDKN